MKRLTPLVFLLLFQLAVTSSALAQGFPYHLYETRTLGELIDLNVAAIQVPKDDRSKQIMISANPFYSAIRFEYGGQSRIVSKDRLSLFKLWGVSMGIRSDRGVDPMEMIEKEYLFRECGKDYWIPVQKPAARDLPSELKSGDMITLYLMMVGGTESNGKWDWMFFTNSFKVYPKPTIDLNTRTKVPVTVSR